MSQEFQAAVHHRDEVVYLKLSGVIDEDTSSPTCTTRSRRVVRWSSISGRSSASTRPAASAPTTAEEFSAPAELTSQSAADSAPEAKNQPKEAESACNANSTWRGCKCERGDTKACLEVADAAFLGRKHDLAIMNTYSMCQKGISEACFRAAHYMEKLRIQQRFGTSPSKLYDQAVAMDKAGCAKGDPAACFGYGKLLFTGKHVAADPALGLQHLEMSCTGGHAEACAFLAYETGTGGLQKDKKRALQLLEASCNSGSVASCTLLGDELARKDKTKAHAFYELACNGDDAPGCARLGQVHLEAARFHDAYAAFDKACELEHRPSCVEAGSLAETGKGTSKNPAKARELYKVACDNDVGAGCLSLSIMMSKGLGGERNWRHATELREKACSLNLKEACKETERPKGNPPDWRCDTEADCEALCNERIGRSCTRLGELLADKETAPLVKAQVGKPEPEDGWQWPLCHEADDAYWRGCELGDGIGCLRLGKYEEACTAGVADGCVMFKAAQYQNAEERERKNILRELSKACTQRKAVFACIQVAQLTDDPAESKRLLEHLCRAGNGAACAAQADSIYIQSWGIGDGMCMVDHGTGIETRQPCTDKQRMEEARRDEARRTEKAKLLRRACELGDVTSCLREDFPPDVAQKMADHGLQLIGAQSCGRGGLLSLEIWDSIP